MPVGNAPMLRDLDAVVEDDRDVRLIGTYPANVLSKRLRQHITDEGPKLPKPWLVRRIAELQIAKTPRAARSFALPLQST